MGTSWRGDVIQACDSRTRRLISRLTRVISAVVELLVSFHTNNTVLHQEAKHPSNWCNSKVHSNQVTVELALKCLETVCWLVYPLETVFPELSSVRVSFCTKMLDCPYGRIILPRLIRFSSRARSAWTPQGWGSSRQSSGSPNRLVGEGIHSPIPDSAFPSWWSWRLWEPAKHRTNIIQNNVYRTRHNIKIYTNTK